MTDEIDIQPGLMTDHGWSFSVLFAGRRRSVTVTQAYWRKMTRGGISPMELLRLGLEMAFKQRVAESLPDEFALDLLALRISDFERHIRAEAQAEAAANPR